MTADPIGRPEPRGPAARRGLDSFGGLPPAALYLCPDGFVAGTAAREAVEAGLAWRIARGWAAATLVRVSARRRGGGVNTLIVSVQELSAWLAENDGPAATRLRLLADRLRAPRPAWAGLALERPHVMGIVNVTPDSFSDGGEHAGTAAAIAHGLALRAAGAAILDVGGESTRPGAADVPAEAEIERVVPVIRGLVAEGALVSVDTRRAPVMAAALKAGAVILNDIEALQQPGTLALAADAGAPVALMHMQGEPRTMQSDPHYDVAALDVFDWLEARVEATIAAGLPRDRILVDPGIGFGKSLAHNLELLSALGLAHTLGTGILLGVSRKSFIGKIDGTTDPKRRLGGSLAAALDGWARGAQIVRVHDVAETAQALAVANAIAEAAC
ncbi:dihydropteroate synthase [Aliidongia dinghuensis]|uniref:dihydropteroate synthase n=1 Tax=Aliidongia dinghuensis TaxID=1867774 RepID=A0A8J2YT56_9PROT|nr:dihydropteroate synthase [Aliidongia dinghuensis]GGF16915.1 dihydropteroate synthase [Aliidongia dinghuensis]